MAARPSALDLAAYGALGLPLAMAALPIYVHVPRFYADTLGLSLASVGGMLLASRLFDAIQDPLLGWWSDRHRAKTGSRWVFVGVGAPLLAIGMFGLFNPPTSGPISLSWWLIANLLLVYTAFSVVTVSYQAHGAEIVDDQAGRTRVTAWREGLSLIGVFAAAALPEILAQRSGAREGFAQFSWLFAPLILAAAALTIVGSPPAHARVPPAAPVFGALVLPFRNAHFRRLLVIFVMNGIAASIPATLVLFFIQDVVKRADLTAYFLITYFAAGALGLPFWVWLSKRIGKGRSWLAAMILSICAFVWAFALGANHVVEFFVVCMMSGIGLGADLALPPSILADVIDLDEARGVGRNEGAYFGLWNLVTKLNLALAAGVALPLLGAFGYAPSTANGAQALFTLAAVYALLPCALKALAATALVLSPFIRGGNRGQTTISPEIGR